MSNLRIPIPTEEIDAFCRRWNVKELAVFGSALRDDFGPDSDIDILVELRPDPGLSLFDWMDMIDQLKQIFGRDVDLVEKRAIRNPFRRKAILSSYEVIHAA